jgi:hypothetical protein
VGNEPWRRESAVFITAPIVFIADKNSPGLIPYKRHISACSYRGEFGVSCDCHAITLRGSPAGICCGQNPVPFSFGGNVIIDKGIGDKNGVEVLGICPEFNCPVINCNNVKEESSCPDMRAAKGIFPVNCP